MVQGSADDGRPRDDRAGGDRPTPAPDDEVRAFRRAVREFVRTHHPDLGGDPDVFIAGMRRLRAQYPGAARLAGSGQAGADGGPASSAARDVPVTVYRRGTMPERLLKGLVRRWERQRRSRVR